MIRICKMTVNHEIDPVGVDDIPYFSYSIEESDRNEKQAACRITVTGPDGMAYDTGKVFTTERIMIPCEGELLPETKYTWKVYVWNEKDECFESPEASFETGRMKPFNWEAKWITSDPQGIFLNNKWCPNTTAPYMRKTFDLKKVPEDATLYICGLGYFECFVNGKTVKDTVLDPAFTEYDKASMYKTYKIDNLTAGRNVLAVQLGDGYYNVDTDDLWAYMQARWRDHSKCLIVLKLVYEDGKVEKIISDRSFKGTNGPILSNDVRSMEKYDARRELGDWTAVSYDDSAWRNVTITKAPGGELKGQYSTPMRVVDEYDPKEIRKIDDKNLLVDVGFNTTGWAVLSVEAPAGTEIMLRYSEDFDENLESVRNISGCLKPYEKERFQTDIYITKGEGPETWHPIFKYNGYRYINIRCESGIPEKLSVKIQEVRTDLKTAGEFKCSDKYINKVQEITLRATKTNFHGMPTDCPHREKNGWTGDAQLSAEQLLFNFDGASAYYRWMDDVIRSQRESGQLPGIIPSTGWGFNWGSGPVWDCVCAVIPYTMYLYCGDRGVIRKMYPTIKKYLEFCDTMTSDNIWAFGLGDWCAPGDANHKQCELAVSDTATVYMVTKIAAKIAGILGYREDEKYYVKKAQDIRKAFRKRFITKVKGRPELINCTKCQTSLSLILYYELEEKDEKEYFLKGLIKDIKDHGNHLDVGILGAKTVLNVLIREGEIDLMLKAAMNPTYPGYGDMVRQGATTLWEDWKGSSSQNHHMFGDISACFYKGLAGINPTQEKPGFAKIVFTPGFTDLLKNAGAWHMTPYGKTESAWKRVGDTVELHIVVPTDCEGELKIPKGYVPAEGKRVPKKLKAGTYDLKFVKG